MAIKGTIKPDIVQVNKYQLGVAGLPPLTFTSITGLEEELDTTELPDRTVATGGRTKPVDFECVLPMHHTVERLAMEGWYEECKDPVSPTHKKLGTLLLFSQSNLVIVSFSIIGAIVAGRGIPDMEMDNEGEMAVLRWPMKADEIRPNG